MPDLAANYRDRMKKAFDECYDAVYECEAEEGRMRRDLFMAVPSKKPAPR